MKVEVEITINFIFLYEAHFNLSTHALKLIFNRSILRLPVKPLSICQTHASLEIHIILSIYYN